jgi:hypothetical protein
LREETSGLTDGQIKVGYALMNIIIKGYQWYIDTPEQRFEYSPESIWLIKPETKEWMLELKKSGDLWYNYETYDTFSRYLNMEKSDFEPFIKIWVEDVLKREIDSINNQWGGHTFRVEDVLEKGKQMK